MTSDRKQAVERASAKWIEQLLDMSGRNRLLHYKDQPDHSFDLSGLPEDALAQLMLGNPLRLSEVLTGAEFEAALKIFRSIHRNAK